MASIAIEQTTWSKFKQKCSFGLYLGGEIFIKGSIALFLVREDESMMAGMEKSFIFLD